MNLSEHQNTVERVRARVRYMAFEALYGPLAWAYDWVSRTFFLGQWRRWQRAAIPSLIGPRVLEVGMGTGNLQIDLARAGLVAWGVDLSPQMVRRASRKLRQRGLAARICRARAQALPFPSGKFDSVVSTFPSDYIIEPATMHELARVVRPGGRLVIVPGGWLTPRDARGKAFEGVARLVYGYKGDQIGPDRAAIEWQGRAMSGWYKWMSTLRGNLEAAGFSVSARIASNERGACLVVIGTKNGGL